MTKTTYDEHADVYDLSYEAPVRRHVEGFTFLRLLGDVRGLSILDVACGDGMYTRMLKQLGAASVLGVDISEHMIDVARAKEQRAPLGLTYVVADAADMGQLGMFDVVSAAYLLHYAPTHEHLARVCRALHANLKPGGRLVTLVANPSFPEVGRSDYTTYGFTTEVQDHERDGSPMMMRVRLGPVEMPVPCFRWKRATYEGALRDAGFAEVAWHAAMLAPEGREKLGDAYWELYMRNPHLAAISCVK